MVPESTPADGGLLFIEAPAFSDLADEYLGEEGRKALHNALLENTEAGPTIGGADGARKIRIALVGRGKRGGGRVIYYFRHTAGAVFFLALYPKNEKADLSAADKAAIREMIRVIKEEAYP